MITPDALREFAATKDVDQLRKLDFEVLMTQPDLLERHAHKNPLSSENPTLVSCKSLLHNLGLKH